ncbi:MAG: aldose epimerase family protein [Lentisphaerota bacterium]
MKITKKLYGKISDKEVYLYTLDNGKMSVGIITYGGIITSLKVPDKKGKLTDIVLGFKNLDGYLKNDAYFGALIGRTSGRIADGKFSLDGKTYQLAKNDAELKNLHGGIKGFDQHIWEAADQKDSDSVSLTLSHLSPDGDEGFPGNLNVMVTYKLNIKNEFSIDYLGTTDKATPVVLTNHSYFNLNGEPSKMDILNNVLRIDADHFIPTDKISIPLGKLESVAGNPMDFRKETAIGKRIDDDFAQIRQTRGYDHPWALNTPSITKASISAYSPESRIKIDVCTDQVGVVIYTSNFLDGTKVGKSRFAYPKNYAFCLETQGFPDSVNHPNFPSVIATPKKPYKQKTIWKFSNI